jgi:hypothetical protein
MKLVSLISLILSAFAWPSFAVLSPGYGVGSTDYDWQSNGSMKKTVCLDAQRGVHGVWTKRINGNQNSRSEYYNFKDEYGTWNFGHYGVAISIWFPYYPTLAVLTDGRAVIASIHTQGVDHIGLASDAARGAGAFTDVGIDTSSDYRLPGVAVGRNGVIHVIASSLVDYQHYYDRSPGPPLWVRLTDDGIGGGFFSMTGRDSKVAIVWPDSFNYNLWLRESTDEGLTWGTRLRIHQSDSCRGYLWQDALYSTAGELHVVYDVRDTSSGSPRAQIRHWSPSTGVGLVRSGWWNSKPGANHGTVACPQLGFDARTNTLWCTWVEFTLADTSTEGFSNGEVLAAYSTDNGLNWRGARNLTNSPTPGAPPGACADDRYASLAAVVDDTLRVLYLSSFGAGSSVEDSTLLTKDTMRYYQIPTDSILGVEELASSLMTGREVFLSVAPNPFTSFARIPGHEQEAFSLYDVSGRLVTTYKGSRIGEGLSPGVYFIKAEGRDTKPLRVVKVR